MENLWDLESYEPPIADVPTEHPAGSLEKIDTLRWRVDHGFSLWHPGDEGSHILPFRDKRQQLLFRREDD